MKRRTLFALAVAGVLGSSAASATTYFCQTDPSDVSYKACFEMTSDSLASANYMLVPQPPRVTLVPESRVTVVPEPTFTTYYYVAPVEAPVRVVPTQTITTYEYSGSWPETEPRISTYRYFQLDSAR